MQDSQKLIAPPTSEPPSVVPIPLTEEQLKMVSGGEIFPSTGVDALIKSSHG